MSLGLQFSGSGSFCGILPCWASAPHSSCCGPSGYIFGGVAHFKDYVLLHRLLLVILPVLFRCFGVLFSRVVSMCRYLRPDVWVPPSVGLCSFWYSPLGAISSRYEFFVLALRFSCLEVVSFCAAGCCFSLFVVCFPSLLFLPSVCGWWFFVFSSVCAGICLSSVVWFVSVLVPSRCIVFVRLAPIVVVLFLCRRCICPLRDPPGVFPPEVDPLSLVWCVNFLFSGCTPHSVCSSWMTTPLSRTCCSSNSFMF